MAMVVLMGWRWNWQIPFASQPIADRPAQAVPQAIAPPLVNGQRLLADVEALSFVRFEERDRQQARQYIEQSLQAAGWQPEALPYEGGGINIYAERPGTDPAAGSILLGAHYDTVERSPGADDNATSVATVLETARLLAQQPTPRTLKLILFDQEEIGLVGSKAFVDQLNQGDERDRFKGAVILDMLGYACDTAGCQSYPSVLPIEPPTDRGNFLAVIGDQGHPELVQSFTQPTSSPTAELSLPQVLTLSIPTLGEFTPDLVRSDHAPFWKKGFGAVLVTDTANFRNPHYHQPSDTAATLVPDFFTGSAQRVVNAVTTLLTEM
jgi:Zn-dependent M28 family amino/carboxypeptidase